MNDMIDLGYPSPDRPWATVAVDGTVTIDWAECRRLAALGVAYASLVMVARDQALEDAAKAVEATYEPGYYDGPNPANSATLIRAMKDQG